MNKHEEIHIMENGKLSKRFIAASVGFVGFLLVVGYVLYISFISYDLFLEEVKEQKMTLIRAEEPIKARDNVCPYQVHFEAINAEGQKVRARYCGGLYTYNNEINIKEVLK